MCGRFKRKSGKKKVAEAFGKTTAIEETDFAPGDDLRPQSMQPVVFHLDAGDRRIEIMRWGFSYLAGCSSMRVPNALPGELLERCLSNRTRHCAG